VVEPEGLWGLRTSAGPPADQSWPIGWRGEAGPLGFPYKILVGDNSEPAINYQAWCTGTVVRTSELRSGTNSSEQTFLTARSLKPCQPDGAGAQFKRARKIL
jgi:hypothetical protein